MHKINHQDANDINLYDIFVNLVKVNNNPTKKKLIEIKIQKDFKNEFLN